MAIGTIGWRRATIANGAALSSAIDMAGKRLVAIRQPASVEGTAFGMTASYDGGTTYEAVYNSIPEATGAAPVTALWEVTKSATVAQVIFLAESQRVYGPTHIKLQTEDGLNAASNQTGANEVWVALEDLPAPV